MNTKLKKKVFDIALIRVIGIAFEFLLANYTALRDTGRDRKRIGTVFTEGLGNVGPPAEKSTTSFGLNLAKLVCGAAKLLSTSLQSNSTTREDAQRSVDICVHFLESKRTDDAFLDFVTTTKETVGDDCNALSLVCQDISESSFPMQQHFSGSSLSQKTA